jgi:hypothetical protein
MRNAKVTLLIVFALALASATLSGSALAQTMGEYSGVTASSASRAKCFRSETDYGPAKDFVSAKDNKGTDFKSSDFKSNSDNSSSRNSSSDFKGSNFGSSGDFGPSKW